MKKTLLTLGIFAIATSQSACRLDVGTQVGRHEFRQSLALGPSSNDSGHVHRSTTNHSQPWSHAEQMEVRSDGAIDPVATQGLNGPEQVGGSGAWNSLTQVIDINFVDREESQGSSTVASSPRRGVSRAVAREHSESPLRSTYVVGNPSTASRVGSAFSSYLPPIASDSHGAIPMANAGNRVPAGRAEQRVAFQRPIERGTVVQSTEPSYGSNFQSWAQAAFRPNDTSGVSSPLQAAPLNANPGQSTRRREVPQNAWDQPNVSPTSYWQPESEARTSPSGVAPTTVPTTPLIETSQGVRIEPIPPLAPHGQGRATNTTSASTSLPSEVDAGVSPYMISQVSATNVDVVPAAVTQDHTAEAPATDSSDPRMEIAAEPASMMLMHGTTPRTRSQEPTHSLESLIETAKQSHPQISEASAQIDVAQGLWAQAGLGPNPLVGFSGQQLGSNGQAEQIGLLVEQRLLRGGKLSLSQMVAAREVGQARQRLTLAVLEVEGRVRRAYVKAVIAQRRMHLVEQLATMADENQRLTELLVESREASQVELLRARSQAQLIRAEYEAASRQWEGSVSALEAAVGITLGDPSQPLALADPYPTGELDPLPDSIVDRIAGHPALMEAELKVDQARWKVQRECAELYSDIDVQMVFQYDEAVDSPNGILQVTGPLQIRNRNQGNIRAARAEIVEASQAVERKRLQLEQDFAMRVADYEEARSRIKLFTEPEGILESSRKTTELLRLGVQAGEEDLLALFLAERDRLNAELEYLNALEKGLDVQADLETLMVSAQQ